MKKIIGIDFDNTIVCYHDVFHDVATEQGLIPKSFPKNKEKIRDYLRIHNQENAWTEMQGYVYGQRISHAQPFPGFTDFVQSMLTHHYTMYIISHKTKFPYLGKKYDLHQSAHEWLEKNHYFNIDHSNFFFLSTKDEKCKKIKQFQCHYFIDDLPELLLDAGFPSETEKLLFSPDGAVFNDIIKHFKHWDDITAYLASLSYVS